MKNMEFKPKTALIAGATGLTGSFLLKHLLVTDAYSKVKVLARGPLDFTNDKVHVILSDFTGLNNIDLFADDVFCCLGTTMKKAGSREQFYHVDHDLPLQLAIATKQQGTKQYILISAYGANKKSMFFYNRVKAQVEEDIINTGFEALLIFRPPLLMGPRKEKRTGEEIARKTSYALKFLFRGPLKKFAPLHVNDLSKAMLVAATQGNKGLKIYNPGEIKILAEKMDN